MHNSLRIFGVLVFLFFLQSQSMGADDPLKILQDWASVESEFSGGKIKSKEKEINDTRRNLALRISKQIFVYAQDFKLRELKKLCDEIVSCEDEIPYLKGKRLMSFARDFIRWYEGFKVRVTARVEPVVEDKKCIRVDIKFSKLKPKNESQWNKGNPAQTNIIDPNDSVEFEVGLKSIYSHWNYFADGKLESRCFSFSPARDEAKEDGVSGFGKGYSVKYKFEVSSLAENGFPVRFVDFLKRYGKNAEALCEKDDD